MLLIVKHEPSPARILPRSAKDDGLADGDSAVDVHQGLELVLDSVTRDVKGLDVLDTLLLAHEANHDRVGNHSLGEGNHV